jgi:hypothetical protein
MSWQLSIPYTSAHPSFQQAWNGVKRALLETAQRSVSRRRRASTSTISMIAAGSAIAPLCSEMTRKRISTSKVCRISDKTCAANGDTDRILSGSKQGKVAGKLNRMILKQIMNA